MTSVGSQARVSPPEYFARVAAEANAMWNDLEARPVIAAPWRQLFAQVQSPRHVLSELLQNADDAGATSARVVVEGGVFEFSHNGADFTEDQFRSLCRFGYSNKRNLHTIGFRGVGFKSSFSLGPEVEVRTPTLSVRFQKGRFTEPVWIGEFGNGTETFVRVGIQDQHREEQLRKNLQEWIASPTSLLFFKSIQKLEIDGTRIEQKVLRPGPAAGTQWIRLEGAASHELLVAQSTPEGFPPEAVEEIKQERFADDVELPACAVEIVWGLPSEQRLFVVLPTGVRPRLPFSCNAPFVQDPARMGIKDPAISPTNRWLLARLGRLAASVMQKWLANPTLPQHSRAEAYYLLPAVPLPIGDSDAATGTVRSAFSEHVDENTILLTATDQVSSANSCIAPPVALYDVWSPEVLAHMAESPGASVLSRHVNEHHRRRLQEWGWLQTMTAEAMLDRLENSDRIPRPESHGALAALWEFAVEHTRIRRQPERVRRLAILPVAGADCLRVADRIVRLGSSRRGLRDADWERLLNCLEVLCDDWVQFLGETSTGSHDGDELAQIHSARDLLKQLGLGEPTPAGAIVARAASRLCGTESCSLEDCRWLAHGAAALGVDAPHSLRYFTRDGRSRPVQGGVLVPDPEVESVLPDPWINRHTLHESYDARNDTCNESVWQTWSRSSRSKLRRVPRFCLQPESFSSWRKEHVRSFLRSRGVEPPTRFNYSKPSFRLTDWDFEADLFQHWDQSSDSDPSMWTRLLSLLLRAPPSEWQGSIHADLHESWGSNERRVNVAPIPSKWVCRLRALPCLPDTHGIPRQPAELLVRTPDTEPLQGVEPFVLADLDREETRPLLRLLGCRDTPAGAGSILERLQALSQTPDPPLTEVAKWYDALDRLLARRRPEDLARVMETMSGERLAYADHGEWVRTTELFQRRGDDDPPDTPIVHREFAALALWGVVGVPDRPSAEVILKRLQDWDSGRKLDGSELRRLRSLLRRMPSLIWERCAHWLSLDGVWMPVEFFECALFDDAGMRVRELFPQVKQRTADCRSLSPEDRNCPALKNLRDLGAALEFRLGQLNLEETLVTTKPWMVAVGEAASRVLLPEADAQAQIRSLGQRLGATRHQPFRRIAVTPYLDSTPAGQDYEPSVLWQEHTLYAKDLPPARLMEEVVAELGRHFGSEPWQRAIRACYERDPGFVSEYMQTQFELATAEEDLRQSADRYADHNLRPGPKEGKGAPSAETVTEADGAIESGMLEPTGADAPDPTLAVDDEPSDPPKLARRKDKNPSLIAQFAASQGFRWDGSLDCYVHADQTTLTKGDGLFPWEHRAGGQVLFSYWATDQCLTRNGVEIPAELWTRLQQTPDAFGLVLVTDDHRPMLLRGVDLARMVNGDSVRVYPSKFRLRRKSDV